ncbi:hypothetical protein ACU4GG_03935 [Streptomyces nojiriensis]
MRIEGLLPEHAEQVLGICQAGIDEGNAAFETSAPEWAAFDKAELPGHRFVALEPASVTAGVKCAPEAGPRRAVRTPRPKTVGVELAGSRSSMASVSSVA